MKEVRETEVSRKWVWDQGRPDHIGSPQTARERSEDRSVQGQWVRGGPVLLYAIWEQFFSALAYIKILRIKKEEHFEKKKKYIEIFQKLFPTAVRKIV